MNPTSLVSPAHLSKYESSTRELVEGFDHCVFHQRTNGSIAPSSGAAPHRWVEIEWPEKPQHNKTQQSNATKQNAWRIKATKRPQAEERKRRTFSAASDWPRLRSLLPTTTTTATTMVFAVFVWLRGDCESRKSSLCLTP